MRGNGIATLGVLAALAWANAAAGNSVQVLSIPVVTPNPLVDASQVSITYTANATSSTVGEMVVVGTGPSNGVTLVNQGVTPLTPVSGTYKLDVLLDHSSSTIRAVSGTLTITDGGNDFIATVDLTQPNFGFNFAGTSTSGWKEFDFRFIETSASVLPGVSVGSFLGERVYVLSSTSAPFDPVATFNANFSYNPGAMNNMAKADTFLTSVPAPTTAMGGAALLCALGFWKYQRRTRASRDAAVAAV
jgi:hypothetical protein